MVILGIPISIRQVLTGLGDLMCLLLAAYVGHVVRFWGTAKASVALVDIFSTTTGATTLFVGVHMLFLYLADTYNPRVSFRRPSGLLKLWIAVALGFFVLMAASYALPHWAWGRGVSLGSFFGFGVAVSGWRIGVSFVAGDGAIRQVLLLGPEEAVEPVQRLMIEHPNLRENRRLLTVGEKVSLPLAEVDRAIAYVRDHDVAEVVVAAHTGMPHETAAGLLQLKAQGVRVIDVGTFISMGVGRLPVHLVDDGFMVFGPGFDEPAGVSGTALRLVDVVLSLFGLLLTSPLLIGGVLGVKLTSRGPAFYSQERLGLYERPYTIYKLRTMTVDAERGTGPVWSQGPGDPRVTPVGRILRRTRIDELPQFFNVLRGDMSLVGPRPEREPFVSQLKAQIPYYGLRFAVKPGLTGWAQVCYRYGANVDDSRIKLEYELYAIRNMTPVLYLFILLKTVQTVLVRPGS